MYVKYHLKEHKIPEGFQIYHDRLEVEDILDYGYDAVKFIQSADGWLELGRDYDKRNDPYAIAVLGCTKRFIGVKRRHIGYVPKKMSKIIIESGYGYKIRPRLLKTFIGDTEYVEILFQILGPKGELENFHN